MSTLELHPPIDVRTRVATSVTSCLLSGGVASSAVRTAESSGALAVAGVFLLASGVFGWSVVPNILRGCRTAGRRELALWLGITGAVAWLLLRAGPVNSPATLFHSVPLRLLFHAINVCGLWAVLFFIGRMFVYRTAPAERAAPAATWPWLIAPVGAWLVWWLALFPGLMTSDSTDQWAQAASGVSSEGHPALHTLMIFVARRMWDSPAAVVAIQVVVLTGLVAWTVRAFFAAGVSRRAAAVSSVLLAVAPVVTTMVVALWKDVPFAFAALALTTLVFLAVTQPARVARSRVFWFGFVLAGTVACLLRHNGLPLAVGGIIALWLVLPAARWRSVAALVAIVFFSVGIRLSVRRAFDLQPPPSGIAWVGFLGAHVAAGTPLEADENAVMADLHPLEDRWNYNCYSNVFTVFDGRFSGDALARHEQSLIPLAIELTLRNPTPTFSHAGCASELIWRIGNGAAPLNAAALWLGGDGYLQTIYAAPGAPEPSPVFPGLGRRLATFVMRTIGPETSWLLWRPALPLYLFVLAAVVACLRMRSWRPGVVLLPVLMHSLALAPMVPSQDVRYQYPVWLVSLLFSPALLSSGLRPGREPRS